MIAKNKKSDKGASIIEIIIAFSIFAFMLSGVIMLSFANQTLNIDTLTQTEGGNIARKMIESARAESRGDFASVLSAASSEDIYSKSLSVADITECLKEAIATVTWPAEHGRTQNVAFSSRFSDIAKALALGGDCPSSGPSSGWENPSTFGDVDLSPAGIKGKDVDAFKANGSRYAVLASVHSAVGSPDIWLIGADGCTTILGSDCVILDSLNLGPGINAVDVARDGSSGRYFAYLASKSSTKQFKVVEINFSDPSNPTLILITELNLSGVNPFGSYPEGASIFYYDGLVFVGTKETAGPEFHIFDVSNPESPVELGYLEINHNVNAIAADEKYAYLATSANTKEVIVIDISDPSAPFEHSSFDAKTTSGGPSDEDGISIQLLGSKIYLGREEAEANERDFYILNKSDLSILGSARICWYSSPSDPNPDCLSNNTSVRGIAVSGGLAFLATDDSNAGFQVWNVSDPSNIFQQSKCSAYNYSEKSSAIDFMDNFGFVANESNDALRIIYDLQNICS